MSRQDWRDFFITVFLLGTAFIVALISTVAAEQQAIRLSAIAAGISLLLAAAGGLYIVPRLARRVDLLRLVIRTSVTVEGALFVVLLVVIAFAAWNTGNNLLYLVFSALVAFLLAANFMARNSLADLSVQLRFPDHIFAGEACTLTITVTNHKRVMPSFSLLIEALSNAASKNLGKLAHFVSVPAVSSARQRLEHTFESRGRYPITAFRVSTRFPTGFFKKWKRVEASGEILVYPKPRPVDDFYHTLPMLAGMVSSHARGFGDDLYAIRRYHPSDHIRNIDWKATARSLALMVREHIREDERRLTIVLDNLRPFADQEFERKFESAVVMAASLANHFILEQADVELLTCDEAHNVRSGSGLEHLYRILRSLATVETKSESDASSHFGQLVHAVPLLADERRFKVLITSLEKGTIPANVWRSAHVVFTQDL